MILLFLIFILSFVSISYCKKIKKYSNVIYLITILITILSILTFKLKLNANFPEYINKYFIGIFPKGTVSLAFFTIVMFTGVFKNSSKIKRKLMSIRGELSIIACIVTLGHNIYFGMYFFVVLFTNPGSLSTTKFFATIISIILILLMLPLMITSFTFVRKRISHKTWKRIQRLAYIFYGLIYVHILLLYIPKIQKGKLDEIIIYSIIFIGYYLLRIYKYVKEKKYILQKAYK